MRGVADERLPTRADLGLPLAVVGPFARMPPAGAVRAKYVGSGAVRYSPEQSPIGPRKLLLDRVAPGSRVLDVGCWTGYYGKYLAERGCTMVGVELDPTAARTASVHYESVVLGDAADPLVQQRVSGNFDAILLLDVIEHVSDPAALLRRAREWVPDGSALISVPNVAHWSIRKALLQGKWEYQDYGILDRTHLRFFTLASARRMLKQSGWETQWFEASPAPIPVIHGTSSMQRVAAQQWPSVFGVQFLFAAHGADGGQLTG